MKPKEIFFTLLIVVSLIVALYYFTRTNRTIKSSQYTWNGLVIKVKKPSGTEEKLAARWGATEVTLQEVFSRAPHLANELDKKEGLEQIAIDSDYYFNVLMTAQTILIEKLAAAKDLNKKIPPYVTFQKDFNKWRDHQNISGTNLKPDQIQSLKLDFADKFQKNKLREMLIKEVALPLEIFISPPADYIQWVQDGIATLGNEKAKAKGLFLCDMMSPVCFEALRTLQEAVKLTSLQINFRPATLSENIYSTLRLQVATCVAKIDASKFWIYFENLEKQKTNTEEPELYELSGIDGIQMQQCMVSAATATDWASHKAFFGLVWRATVPVLIIGGEPVLGPFTLDRVTELAARHGR